MSNEVKSGLAHVLLGLGVFAAAWLAAILLVF